MNFGHLAQPISLPFALFRRLSAAKPDSNVFISPLSVSLSLGMAMNGAAGNTLDEIRSTLGFGVDELAVINDGYRSIVSLEQGLDPNAKFEIANSIWYRENLSIRQSFIDVVTHAFGADVRPSSLDMTAIREMNDWVSERTHGRIPSIVTTIDSNQAMLLVNAIYFKGAWRDSFDPAETIDRPFQATTGVQLVKTLHRRAINLRQKWTPTEYIAESEYGNSAIVMDIVLPLGANTVDAIISGLDTASWSARARSLAMAKASVRLPKFRLEYERELTEELRALGMRTPFAPGAANFDAMSPAGQGLYISFVKSKTFASINEEGTEAAVATSTGMEFTSAPGCFCVDRPFLFIIRERFSDTIVFMGKIVRIP